MAQLEITLLTYDEKERNVCARIPLPNNVAPPPAPLNSWQDLIRWLLEHPEIIAQIIAAILSIWSSKPGDRKTT